jgi:5-methylcytosine-specific restriction endonuclease McrA
MQLMSRDAATAAGLKRYFTGEPCVHGHVCARLVKGSVCVECSKLRRAKNKDRFADYYASYREQHRDKARIHNRAYYAERADEMREYARQYRRENLEEVRQRDRDRHHSEARKASRVKDYQNNGHKKKRREKKRYQREHIRIKERVTKYRTENPDKVRESSRPALIAARARKKNAPGRFKRADIKRMLKEQNGICVTCPADISLTYQVDHIVPLARGGTNWPDNLQLLCGPCNQSKGPKTMSEWIAWRAEMRRHQPLAP